MKALVLEKKLKLALRDIDLPTEIGPDDVKIKMHTVKYIWLVVGYNNENIMCFI